MFSGERVPYFVIWSEEDSIIYTIVVEILKEFDTLNIFPRTDVKFYFVLLDSYGIRIKS